MLSEAKVSLNPALTVLPPNVYHEKEVRVGRLLTVWLLEGVHMRARAFATRGGAQRALARLVDLGYPQNVLHITNVPLEDLCEDVGVGHG